MWAFWDKRYTDCLTFAGDVLFGHQLLGTTWTPPSKMREYIKQMIAIIEKDTPISKERWTSLHPTEDVQAETVFSDSTNPVDPTDQTLGDFQAITTYISLEASTKGNSKQS